MVNITKLFLLFSHKLTSDQIKEAKERFNIDEFMYLPDCLQSIWSDVPPHGEISENYLDDIKEFILSNAGDTNYVLVMGEYGLTYSMVNWCFDNGYIPFYATTRRIYESKENEDGSVNNIHVFKHVSFRKYKKY